MNTNELTFQVSSITGGPLHCISRCVCGGRAGPNPNAASYKTGSQSALVFVTSVSNTPVHIMSLWGPAFAFDMPRLQFVHSLPNQLCGSELHAAVLTRFIGTSLRSWKLWPA